MARKRREYEDDDGRTIADMSGMGQPHSMGVPLRPAERPMEEERKRPEWEKASPLTFRERLSIVWLALRAGLLIGLAFIVGLGLVIALMLLFWA